MKLAFQFLLAGLAVVTSKMADLVKNVTETGAIDVIVMNDNETLKCSPIQLSYSLMKVPRPDNKRVQISVNGVPVKNIDMRLDKNGRGRLFPSNGSDRYQMTPEELATLNLLRGANLVEFNVDTPIRGAHKVSSYFHFNSCDDRFVISDIDGTITQSDLLGNVLNPMGIDWTHANVAPLYNAIVSQGYIICYLSTRSMGMSDGAHKYLKKIWQNGTAMPDGPVILAPENAATEMSNELIKHTPQEFKINCLKTIQRMCPGVNIFTHGIGNHPTDTITYKAIGIQSQNIFIIDPKDVVVQGDNMRNTSFGSMIPMVPTMFPKVKRH